jgi:DNA mismatch endonuclease, patch repair protein
MASISGIDSKPEILVRSYLFKQGYRFRKNVKTLKGTPDIVLAKLKTVIFINGCFWHGHHCKRGRIPHTNAEFWSKKIQGNKTRDKMIINELIAGGWQTIVIWDCELNNKNKFENSMKNLTTKLILSHFTISDGTKSSGLDVDI